MRVLVTLFALAVPIFDRIHCQSTALEDSSLMAVEGSGQSVDMERPSDSNWLLTSSGDPLVLSQEFTSPTPLPAPDAANKDQWTTPKVVAKLPGLLPFLGGHSSDVHTLTPDQIPIRIPSYQLADVHGADKVVKRLCLVLGRCQPEVIENEMIVTSIVPVDESHSEPAKKDHEHFIYPPEISQLVGKTSQEPSAPKECELADQVVSGTESDNLTEQELTTAEPSSYIREDIPKSTEPSVKSTRSNAAIYSRYRMNSSPVVRMPPSITTKKNKVVKLERDNRRVDRLPSHRMTVSRRNFTGSNPVANSSTNSKISYSPSYGQVSGVTIGDNEGQPRTSTEPTATTIKVISSANHPNFQEFLKHVQYSYHASPVLSSGYASVKLNH